MTLMQFLIWLLVFIGGAMVGHVVTGIVYERRYGWLIDREREFQERIRRMGRPTEEEEAP
jgi:hypothetical protein